ncbi:hypothetical protein SCP_0706040 [Sparassis crispa]|uniref:Geranylgeranyl pyrophosphate synthetase n=1 Tax=Sparassis crispa TaxID=139825 RepID=A0A401GT78_9APHY|nr:hypothetical protein SCP_0706040 [Sparassis crispa]GBE85417.1 hypothetical protein SCP_0706040 [Sparassis crispa]
MSYRSYNDNRGRGQSYGPRRGSRGGARAFPNTSLPGDREMMDGLISTPILTLARPADVAGKAIEIKNLEYLGSYNWVNSTEPIILVPGSPPIWRNRPTPYAVPRDTGMRFVDQSGYRMPSSILLPLFRATDVVAEQNGTSGIDWKKVDFITDRNGLRKLLRWINDKDGSAKEFRIDTQLAGKGAILFNRWEKRTREEADPSIWSYGFSFERESTTPAKGCEQSSGHHRIVKYDFDGLQLVVRFEVDACVAQPSAAQAPTSTVNADSLSDLLSGLNVARDSQTPSASKKTDTASGTGLEVQRAGSQVPQSSLIEMTTRSKHRVALFDWVDAFPQLFLSQTSNHYLATHDRGRFETITKRKLGDPELKRIQDDAQASFRKLRRALQEIKDLVMLHGRRGRLSLVFREGKLQVLERVSEASCLPETIMKRFE